MTSQGLSPVSKKADFINLPGMSMGMLLQIQFEGRRSLQSRLIGLDYNNFIITQTPPMADIGPKLYEKNHGIIRYLFSGHIYAFRCTLLSLINRPYPLSIFSYPEAVETINLRTHERIPCMISAEVNLGGRMSEGIVSNISMGGCSFEMNQTSQREFPDFKIQDEIIIDLKLQEQGEATIYNAIVRAVHMDEERMMVGFQFVSSEFKESDLKSERELREYLLTLQNS